MTSTPPAFIITESPLVVILISPPFTTSPLESIMTSTPPAFIITESPLVVIRELPVYHFISSNYSNITLRNDT